MHDQVESFFEEKETEERELTVTTVAHSTFNHTSSFLNCFHANLELFNIVQGVEHPEYVHSILLGLLAEMIDGIVGQRLVSHTICATKETLERNVGYELSHLSKTVPLNPVVSKHVPVRLREP